MALNPMAEWVVSYTYPEPESKIRTDAALEELMLLLGAKKGQIDGFRFVDKKRKR